MLNSPSNVSAPALPQPAFLMPFHATESGSSSTASSGTNAADPLQHLQQLNGSLDERVFQPTVLPHQPQHYYNYYIAQCCSAFNAAAAVAANSDPTFAGCKKNGGRQTYNADQKKILEDEFRSNRYVSKLQRTQLVEKTGLSDKQIKIWFQNRRMKKKKQEQGGGNGTHDESSPPLTPMAGLVPGLNGTTVKSEPENMIASGAAEGQPVESDFLKCDPMAADPSGTVQTCYQQQGGLPLPSAAYYPHSAAVWPAAGSSTSAAFNNLYFSNFNMYQQPPSGYGGYTAAATSQYPAATPQYPWVNSIVGRTMAEMGGNGRSGGN